MKGMEKISEAVLDKVKREARGIVKEAEDKRREELEKAQKGLEERIEEEKNRLLEEAREEAARITAQASIKARQELLAAKTGVVDKIVDKAKKELAASSGNNSPILKLIKEASDLIDISQSRVYVSPRDVAAVQKLINDDKEFAGKKLEVKEFDCSGGVIIEDASGKIRIDNTYETRLEMLLPKLMPEINKQLFKDL